MQVRVRFAPSPTGHLHIGGARTALFNWLLARKEGGTFILRIEDTDRERSTPEAVQAILDGLTWMGIDWDEGPIFQTQRMGRYEEVLREMLSRGTAYRCTHTPEEVDEMRKVAEARGRKPRYDGSCRRGPTHPDRPSVIRLRARDEGLTAFDDLIKGRIAFDNQELDDLILARSDGSPTYNFCVVVDDHDMDISHVLRGDDHVNNTPRQIQIYEALGWKTPVFAHVPMILGADKKRLSKRHGATSVTEYRNQGFLPWALVNYLARLGWSAGDQEIFSKEELIAAFSVEGIGHAAAVFSPDKLQWVNAHYLKEMSPSDLGRELAPFLSEKVGRDVSGDPRLPGAAALYQKRAKTLVEMASAAAFFLLRADEIAYDPKAQEALLGAQARPTLEKIVARLAALPEFRAAAIEPVVSGLAEEEGVKLVQVAQPVRVALTGGTASPGLFEVMELLGREETLARLRRALHSLSS
jgi:glutamyl-tRNA synthetase